MTSKAIFNSVLFVFMLILINACSVDYNPADEVDNSPAEKRYSDVDSRLWEHFEKFENEARLRNQIFNLNALGITGVISDIPDAGVAGTCQYGQHIHHVTVDQQYWNNASDLQREMVVFHELGHCVLGRGHREGANNNGICISVMNSGLADCRVIYSNTNRPLYLDELFYFDD